MASDADQEVAEGRRENESWREMLERTRKDSSDGDSWQRMRALPNEQKQEKEKGRGDLFSPQEVAWNEQLKEASQRAAANREMER